MVKVKAKDPQGKGKGQKQEIHLQLKRKQLENLLQFQFYLKEYFSSRPPHLSPLSCV